ncbi:MAG: Gfo/Idh/MocA family oxidoreductase, partial [Deltaproteobacteria bacterium]|nr:Gfo/Idh/MocA family oxidoreductase [Deltaproteobacteria bacterium]
MKKRYKAAIIGCGRVAWQLELDPLEAKPCSHMGGYLGLGNIDIIAGADINEDNLNAFGKAYNISNLYIDYKDMLNEEMPDVVSICA